MTKISRWDLRAGEKRKIVSRLYRLLSSFRSVKESERFFQNFFSPSEVVIFAKRLSALKMLAQKKPYFEIAQRLKMSPSTFSKMANRLRADKEFKNKVFKLS